MTIACTCTLYGIMALIVQCEHCSIVYTIVEYLHISAFCASLIVAVFKDAL